MPSPSFSASPTSTPVSEEAALAELRATVDEGREKKEINEDTAAAIDRRIDAINNVSPRMMSSMVAQLKRDIEGWVQNEAIKPERANLLYAAIDAWAAASSPAEGEAD